MEGDRTNKASGQRKERVDIPSTSQPCHKHHPCRLDEMLIEVSEALLNDSDVRKLGLKLGVKNPAIDRALATNWASGIKTSNGNLEMLQSWAKTVKQSEQIPTLTAALENLGLGKVTETCLPSCHTDYPTGMPDEILKLREKLKARYRKKFSEVKISPVDSASRSWLQHVYVNLILMLGLRGEREEEIDYNSLFEKIKTETQRGFETRFAFLGEAGVGKSTLFAKIAFDWAEGRILQEIDLLFLESFREIEEHKYFGDIVMNHFPDDMETEGKQVDKYIRENQRKVVILLDGLDEAKINIKRPNRNDAVVSMIRGERFTDTTVLITTRPFGADQIKGIKEVNEQYTYIKVKGFSKKNMSTYIKQYFRDDPESASSLIMFMNTNQVAEHMAPFPIFCCMLCFMWKEPSGRKTIQTMTTFSQLLDHLVFSLQEHYSSMQHDYSMNMKIAEESMKDLSYVAFHGLLEKQLIFDEESVRSCIRAAMTACKVGILSKEERLAPLKIRHRVRKRFIQEFSFPHKLLQEYTASSFLVSLFRQDRPDFERILTDKLLQHYEEFRYVLYFTAAHGGEVGKRVMEVLCEKVDDTDFIMEVAYECYDREAIDPARNLLKIQTDLELRSHSDAGYLFTLATLGEKIERECSLFDAEKWAVGKSIKDHAALAAIGLCSLQDLQSLAICEYNEHTSLDDDFYTGMSAAASLSKIQELKHQASIGGLIKLGPTASCHYARGLCSMPNLRSLELKGVKPSDEFFATMASEASASKGIFPQITKGNFRFNGSSVESLESFKRMLSEYQGIVSEEEFGKLSELTPPSHYMQVGKVLEIPDAQLSDIKNQSDNIIIAFKKVFKKWRESQPPGINIRAVLVEKLKESELDEVAGRLHNKSLISNITVVTGNDPERIKAYEEALASRKVRCNRSRIMVVGPAGIGKTSLIRRLTGQPFNPEEESTVGTEHNTVNKNVVTGWELDNDTKKDDVAECMVLHKQLEEQEKPLHSSAKPSDASHSAPSDVASPSETNSSSEDSHDKGNYMEKHKSLVEIQHEVLPSSAEAGVQDIPPNPLKRKFLSEHHSAHKRHKALARGLTEERITNATSTANDISYSIWDFGGQVIYYITHPLFLSWRSLYIVVFPFHLDFNAKPPRTEEINLQGATPRTHRTILDLLHFWLMSIYVHAIPPRDRERFEPKILLVGTFRHEPGITEEDVKSKTSQIKKMVRGKPYAKQVHSEILQIDNSSSSEKEVAYIQEQIDKLVKESAYMQEDLPIRWRTFSDKMRALKRDILLLDQARTAMTDVRIIKDIEVELVLEFYHDTGDLVYHQGCELIVLNPQILNDFVSNIITVIDDEKLDGELGDDWKTLIEKGILTMKLLEAVWESNKGKPGELKYMVDMMVRFDLICKIPKDSQFKTDILQGCYFVPCCSRPELGEVQKPNKDYMDDEFKFIIDFHKFLPDGFLHRLYVRMALWSMIGCTIPYKPTFHCREMLFYIDELHRVVMTNTIEGDDAHRVKVLIYRLKPKGAPEKWDKQPIHLKRDFLTYLKVTLRHLKMTWARRISYSLGLPCANCRDKGKRFSLVSLDAFLQCEDSAHCGECGDAIHAGRVKQALLCSPARATEESSESRKDLDIESKILELSQKMPTGKYFKLCNKLGIGYDEANSFLVQYSNDYTRATMHCLVQWKVNENDCLSKLKTILPKIEASDLVKYLE